MVGTEGRFEDAGALPIELQRLVVVVDPLIRAPEVVEDPRELRVVGSVGPLVDADGTLSILDRLLEALGMLEGTREQIEIHGDLGMVGAVDLLRDAERLPKLLHGSLGVAQMS
jgi:hypothetical protein